MSDEHWENLKEIFHAVVALAPKDRETYLNSACRGDDAMRLKIESLIAAHEKTNDFIDLPAYQAAAEMLIDDQEFKPGQTLSHYEIHSLLGVGGMGKVYLAADTHLGRQVALKMLPAEYTSNRDRVHRFQQEARAASALNHPNIVTIYEIGQTEERHFIASEFIDGETLRQRLNRSQSHIVTTTVDGPPVEPLKLSEVLSIGMQVADALAAAHAKGIVHRDVKPENIILIRDGHLMQKEFVVKVLDFGIAKLTHEDVAVETKGIKDEPATRALLSTLRGSVVGTVRYMSPEQARGETVDLRTDIWSLGVVLYEMLSDRLPFSGDTAPDVIASIMKTELPPLTVAVPERLRWIVEKALRKDRAERYQSAAEIFSDLRDFQRHPDEIKGTTQRAAAAELSSEKQGTSIATVRESQGARAASTARGERHIASTLGYLPNHVKRLRRSAIVGLIALVIAAAVIALTLSKFINHQPPNRVSQEQSERHSPFQTMKMAKLTSTGKAASAAISPDGKYLAYVKDENAQQSLWLQQTSIPGSGVQLLPPSVLVLSGLRFSDDAKSIYYQAETTQVAELFRLPLQEGVPQKLITDIDSVATFSPDGHQLAFLRGYPLRKETALLLANADGSGERALATHGWVNGFPTGGGTAAWSPDGSIIVCPMKGTDAKGRYATLLAVNVANGTEIPISSHRFWQVGTIAWLRDGTGLVFTARERISAPSQIWYLSYPAGVARRITSEINDYVAVSVTADSASVVAVVSDQISNIWVAPHDDARRAIQITSNRVDGATGMAWTPNGQIVYASGTSRNLDLWIVAADGTGQKQLTANSGNNSQPSVSADGRYVVFVSDRTGARHLWRIDIDGRNALQMTNGEDELEPHCSPTESLVAYDDGRSLYRVSLDGGQPIKIVGLPSPAVISPDGKWVTASYFADATKTAIYSLAGGEPQKIVDIPPWSWLDTKWTPDGNELAYLDNKNLEISTRPIAGGPPKRLINFAPDLIFDFAWSRDGKQLAVARGTLTHDVVIISGFKDSQ